jgi:ComF family protein
MNISRLIFFIREFFFPSGCALCGALLFTPEETWYGLCEPCREKIERNLSYKEKGAAEDGVPFFDRIIAFYPYTGAYRLLLGAYKFNKNMALGHFFADKMRETWEQFIPPENEGGAARPSMSRAALIPVPPRPGKIKKTGWDQVEHLAGLLQKRQRNRRNPAVCRCLKRLRSRTQKQLDRADRRQNLKGRIILTKTPPKNVILFDDVITTGSTLEACAETLKNGGAEKIQGICLFYD